MSVALYCTLRRWGGVNQKLSARGKGRGALHAVNPTHCNIPPMRVLGSARIPIVFLPEDCVHNITVRIVEGLPYGFILGARFFYANKSILNFGTDKGFKPTPASPWVPFLDKNMTASNPLAEARTTPLSRRRAQAVPNKYHRRERIGQRDHPGPGLRLPRPVLEGTVRGQRLGGAVTTRAAPNGRSTPGRHLGTQPPTPPHRERS